MAYSPIEQAYMDSVAETQLPTPEPEPMMLADSGQVRTDAPQDFGSIKGIPQTRFEKILERTGMTLEQIGNELDKLGKVNIGGVEIGVRDILPFVGSVEDGKVTGTPAALQAAGRGEPLTRGTGFARQMTTDAKLGVLDVATAGVAKPAMQAGKAAVKGAVNATKNLPVGMSIKVLDNPLPIDKVTRNKNFKAWAQGNEIKDEAGKPQVLYHGTTHDFDTFTLERANPENYFGEGFYFTDKVEDANRNYAGVGPDLMNRIERRIEDLDATLSDPMGADEVIQNIASRNGVKLDLFYDPKKQSFNDLDGDTKRQVFESIARKELTTNQGTVMPVFAKMENPVKLGTKDETRYVIDTKWDDETGDLLEESGNGIDLLNAFKQTADDWGLGSEMDDAYAKLLDKFADGEASAGEIDKILRDTLVDLYDIDGNYVGAGKFIADMFKNMGHDGIIMNAEEYFGPDLMRKGMQGVKGANHYILFEPTNIKSAIGNRGTFDPKDPSIVRGVGIGGTGAAASQQQENN